MIAQDGAVGGVLGRLENKAESRRDGRWLEGFNPRKLAENR